MNTTAQLVIMSVEMVFVMLAFPLFHDAAVHCGATCSIDMLVVLYLIIMLGFCLSFRCLWACEEVGETHDKQ